MVRQDLLGEDVQGRTAVPAAVVVGGQPLELLEVALRVEEAVGVVDPQPIQLPAVQELLHQHVRVLEDAGSSMRSRPGR
jgi:hypothetical protein